MHHRVADKHQFHHGIGRNTGIVGQLTGQLTQSRTNRPGQLHFAARVHHHVGDATHQVFPEADLGVHASCGGEDFASGEIAQVRGDGGGPDVDGNADDGVEETGPDADDNAVAHRRRHVAAGLLHHRDEAGQHPGIDHHVVADVEEPAAQDLRRAATVVDTHQRHERQRHERVDDDTGQVDALAHDLAVHLTLRRHVDHNVSKYARRASEPPTRGQRALAPVIRLGLTR